MGVHVVGEARRVDRILIERIEVGQYLTQDRSDHVGWKPRDAVIDEQLPRQARLADPRRSAYQEQRPGGHVARIVPFLLAGTLATEHRAVASGALSIEQVTSGGRPLAHTG